MKHRKLSRLPYCAVCIAMGIGGLALVPAIAEDAPEAKPDVPTVAPAAPAAPTPAAVEVTISPDAKTVLDQMAEAYGKVKSLELAGAIRAEFDVDGQQRKASAPFSASFSAPNKFRHETQDDLLFGSTGDKAFAYLKRENAFAVADAPKERIALKELPPVLSHHMMLQDPSLGLALSKDPMKELTSDATDVAKVEDTKLENTAYPTLRLTLKNKSTADVLIHPETHLLRQYRTDMKKLLEGQGAADVKSALLTVDYATTTLDGDIKNEQFAWTPPEGAREAAKGAALAAGGEGDAPAAVAALEGKPAPNFKLKNMDGKEVALADLKGKVVIVDFWATWCGPCRASLPHLQKVYEEKKDAGLKAFALDLKEEKDDIAGFIKETKLSIPVLLDADGATAEKYSVEGIPQTVIIGKDGIVKKVFVGFSEEGEETLRKIVDEAMKG